MATHIVGVTGVPDLDPVIEDRWCDRDPLTGNLVCAFGPGAAQRLVHFTGPPVETSCPVPLAMFDQESGTFCGYLAGNNCRPCGYGQKGGCLKGRPECTCTGCAEWMSSHARPGRRSSFGDPFASAATDPLQDFEQALEDGALAGPEEGEALQEAGKEGDEGEGPSCLEEEEVEEEERQVPSTHCCGNPRCPHDPQRKSDSSDMDDAAWKNGLRKACRKACQCYACGSASGRGRRSHRRRGWTSYGSHTQWCHCFPRSFFTAVFSDGGPVEGAKSWSAHHFGDGCGHGGCGGGPPAAGRSDYLPSCIQVEAADFGAVDLRTLTPGLVAYGRPYALWTSPYFGGAFCTSLLHRFQPVNGCRTVQRSVLDLYARTGTSGSRAYLRDGYDALDTGLWVFVPLDDWKAEASLDGLGEVCYGDKFLIGTWPKSQGTTGHFLKWNAERGNFDLVNAAHATAFCFASHAVDDCNDFYGGNGAFMPAVW